MTTAEETKVIPVQERVKSIEATLQRYSKDLEALMPARFRALMLPRLLTIKLLIAQHPTLANCTAASWVKAMMTAAALGIDPDGTLGRAWVIPYGQDATFQLGFQGALELARRSDDVADIDAFVVRKNDKFEFSLGLDPKLVHVPVPPDDKGEFGELIAVYAVMRLKGGLTRFRVMWKAEVEKHRKASKAPNSPAWAHWYDQMALKTVLLAVCKYGPKSTELERAIQLEEAEELRLPPPIPFPAITEGEGVEEPKTKAGKLTEELKKRQETRAGNGGATSAPPAEKAPEVPAGTAASPPLSSPAVVPVGAPPAPVQPSPAAASASDLSQDHSLLLGRVYGLRMKLKLRDTEWRSLLGRHCGGPIENASVEQLSDLHGALVKLQPKGQQQK